MNLDRERRGEDGREDGIEGFEGFEDDAAEVNAAEEMERAKREVQELEEKKSLTMGGQHVQAAPKMNIKVRLGCVCVRGQLG